MGPPRYPDPYADEISLRELYLILRRGLLSIVGIAVLAGAIGFLWSTVRPETYLAEATVINTPSPFRVQELISPLRIEQDSRLAFEPSNTVSFDAYRAIAMGQSVFDAVAAGPSADDTPTVDHLRAAADVEQLSGPANPSQIAPLTIRHTVQWSDPGEAAHFAHAWAEATVEAVQDSLLASLEPIRSTTAETVSSRRATRNEAAAALEEFVARDDTAVLESRLVSLREQISQLEVEQTAGAEQLGDLRQRASEIRAELSRLARERYELLQDLEQATEAYRSVALLQPTIDYMIDLAPSSIRVVETTGVSLTPTGPSTLVVTLLALVIGGMAGTLFVFVREAVSE